MPENTKDDNQQNDPQLISKYELQRLVNRIYKFNRSHMRFMKTIILFAKAIGKEEELAKAYYQALKEEKENLLDILEKQLNYLIELNSPPHLIASKQQESDAARETLEDIKLKGTNLIDQELKNLKKILTDDIYDLTSNFVADCDYPTNLLFEDDDENWKFDLIKT